MTCKILSRVWGWGWDGLSEDKANLSPAKLKLADIGLELSLAIKVGDKVLLKNKQKTKG